HINLFKEQISNNREYIDQINDVLPELNEQVVRNLPLDSFTLETVLAICDNISLTSLTTYLNNASNPDPSLVLRTLLKTKYIYFLFTAFIFYLCFVVFKKFVKNNKPYKFTFAKRYYKPMFLAFYSLNIKETYILNLNYNMKTKYFLFILIFNLTIILAASLT